MFAASKTDGAVAAAQADPFFNSVAALLNTSGTNGAQNNTFIDSSTNNFTVTRSGNTTQGSFSPYGEDWSNYFDGTGDGLSTPSFSANLATWTMEFWLNTTGTTDYQTFVHRGNGAAWGDTSIFDLYMRGTTTGVLEFLNGTGGVFLTGTQRINDGVWHHIAFTYDGTNYRLFVDGKLDARQATSAMSTASYLFYIGYDPRNLRYTTGYISNFRFVTGSVVYATTSTTIGATIFTPPTQPLQPIAGTGLLTCKDPNIVDDSANNFTITRNGDVSVQKFGPFPGVAPSTPYFSAFLDGTGDYLTAPTNAAFGYGTGDLTIEFWLYLNTTGLQTAFSNLSSGSSTNPHIYINTTIRYYTAGADRITGATLSAGQWIHVALCRSSGSTRLFINGTQSGSTYTDSNNYGTSAPLGIGTYWDAGTPVTSNTLNGYISNVRVVKGQALYTTSFTPSTVPLTTTSQGATASNVSLLTCQSSTFVDNSPNNFTITAVGDSRPTAFAPFAVTYTSLQPYTPAVFGGSMYFDGNGDTLSIPASSALLGAGNFTVEFWVNVPVTLAGGAFYTCFAYGSTGSVLRCFIYESSGVKLGIWIGSALNPINVSFVPFIGTWTHVAITRVGTTLTLYVNGVSSGTYGSDSTNYNAGQLFVASQAGGAFYAGYISDFRVIVGTARYTSNFVPQNTPLTAVTNTALLLNATNAGIYDAAGLNDFETVGNAQVSTSVKVYGTSSISLDGNGDYLVSAPTLNLSLGTSNFTIEGWVYYNTRTNSGIFQIGASLFPLVNGIGLGLDASLNWLLYYANGSQTAASTAPANATWTYFAVVRNNGTTRVYANGIATSIAVADTANYTGTVIGVGGIYSTGFLMNGYVQDLRITRGIARYTTNFTPPSAPLPTF